MGGDGSEWTYELLTQLSSCWKVCFFLPFPFSFHSISRSHFLWFQICVGCFQFVSKSHKTFSRPIFWLFWHIWFENELNLAVHIWKSTGTKVTRHFSSVSNGWLTTTYSHAFTDTHTHTNYGFRLTGRFGFGSAKSKFWKSRGWI